MGRYRGKAGFETFSNIRTKVRQARWTLARLLDPPYSGRTLAMLERLFGRM